ncbi:MAG: GT-D fold domain-containing glycosyltransferase [Syntrophomonas sp.]|nr:GT-D fold domain-containing glycosyltransferase [Syntrophomonas sp.]
MQISTNKGMRIPLRKWPVSGNMKQFIPNIPVSNEDTSSVFWQGSESDTQLLSSGQLMDKILHAIEAKEPLSIVSVGATEAFVMAQYTIYSEKEFMSHREAYNANRGERSGFFHRGIRFPNIQARDDAVEAAKKASIVGYNTIVNDAKSLANKVFKAYDIRPQYIFEANLRRVLMFSQKEKFKEMLRGKKILLIGSLAPEARIALNRNLKTKLGFDIVGAISIYDNEEIPQVKKEIEKYDFDLCILAAGTNALILAPYIAETYGKVAFDIGWGIKSLITGEVVHDMWIDQIIGLENLLNM